MTPDFEIRYSNHYVTRIRDRPYLEGCGEMVFQSPDARFYDLSRNTIIAVKRMYVLGAERDVALAYDIQENVVMFVSIFILKERQSQNRLREGRWAPYEPASEL